MSGTAPSNDPSRHRALAIAAVSLLTVSLFPSTRATSHHPLVVGPTGIRLPVDAAC